MTYQASKDIFDLLEKKQKRSFFAILALLVVGTVLEAVGIGAILPVVAIFTNESGAENNRILQGLAHLFSTTDRTDLTNIAIIGLVGLYLVKAAFLTLSAYFQNNFIYSVHHELASNLLKKYLNLPYEHHLTLNSATPIKNIMQEVANFTVYVLMPFLFVLSEILVSVGLFSVLLYINPFAATISLGLFVLMGFSFTRLGRKQITHWGQTRQHHEFKRMQYLNEALGGIKDVFISNKEAFFSNRFSYHNKKSADLAMKQTVVQSLPRLWIEFFAIAVLGVLLFYTSNSGSKNIEVIPLISLYAAAAFRLMPSASRIVSSLQNMKFGLPSVSLLKKELSLPSKTNPESHLTTAIAFDTIAVKNLSYQYPTAGKKALNNVSILVNKGESIGVIGKSGSGKSTFLDLLLGLLKPSQGGIFVDQNNLTNLNENWLATVGYVPQTIFLTDDTLKQNIALGLDDKEIDTALLNKTIKDAELTELIADLPLGIDTPLGERGIRLSGGQRQRIGIARALYRKPKLLVLDEATSALDEMTEKSIMDAVYKLSSEMTIVIVTHRLSTVRKCDRIYELSAGEVLTTLSPTELVHPRT